MGVMMVNYMYCTGQNGKMLTDTMMHGQVPSKVQVEAVQRLEDASKLWVKDSEDKVTFANWEHLSESLGDMYTGQGVCKSYSLTLEAIIPTTPGKGEAARVDLSSVVSEHLKAYVDDPSRVRIPDEELVNPHISAKVQVDSQEEWNKIVSHLCQAGMLEREVLSRETPHPVGRQSGCSQCTLQRSQWRKSTANAIKANHGSLGFYGILVLSRLGEVQVESSRWAQQMGSQTTLKNPMPPRKVVMARRGTHERKRDRQALGTLQSLVVHATTEKRYFEAVSRCLEFLKMHAYSYPLTPEFRSSLSISGIQVNQKPLPLIA